MEKEAPTGTAVTDRDGTCWKYGSRQEEGRDRSLLLPLISYLYLPLA